MRNPMQVVAVAVFECVECGDQWEVELHTQPMPSMDGVIRESVCQPCINAECNSADRRRESPRGDSFGYTR